MSKLYSCRKKVLLCSVLMYFCTNTPYFVQFSLIFLNFVSVNSLISNNIFTFAAENLRSF